MNWRKGDLGRYIEITGNLQYLTGDEKQIIDQKIGSIAQKIAGLIKSIKKKAEERKGKSLPLYNCSNGIRNEDLSRYKCFEQNI